MRDEKEIEREGGEGGGGERVDVKTINSVYNDFGIMTNIWQFHFAFYIWIFHVDVNCAKLYYIQSWTVRDMNEKQDAFKWDTKAEEETKKKPAMNNTRWLIHGWM